MPHKRNPILSERIAAWPACCAATPPPALEDQPLWHERDISHSSAERVVLPDATILLDYMLVKTSRAWSSGLVVRPERMRENIDRGLGLHASGRVLLALVEEGGLRREDGVRIVQRNALRAADERALAARTRWPADPAVAAAPADGGPGRVLRREPYLRHVPARC